MIVKKALKHYSFLVIGCLLYRVETPWQGVSTIGAGQSHGYIQNVVSCQTLRFRLQA